MTVANGRGVGDLFVNCLEEKFETVFTMTYDLRQTITSVSRNKPLIKVFSHIKFGSKSDSLEL